MQPIGGYFELELNGGKQYHQNAIALNTGRNALEYILRCNNYTKIFIPYYTCDTILEPIKMLNLDFQHYSIDENFLPTIEDIRSNEIILYTNYFGICDKQTLMVTNKFKNVIVDNCQSFFSKPIKNNETFYSCRKFFGVPDGAYLYSDKSYEDTILQDISYERCEHLLRRIDTNADLGLNSFIKSEKALSNQPIKYLSKLTEAILSNIDYQNVKQIRKTNFNFLETKLKKVNKLDINIGINTIPMIYPLLLYNGKKFKKVLEKNKIYVTTYWPNVFEWTNKSSWENHLAENLLALPIDQRYGLEDMERIVDVIMN